MVQVTRKEALAIYNALSSITPQSTSTAKFRVWKYTNLQQLDHVVKSIEVAESPLADLQKQPRYLEYVEMLQVSPKDAKKAYPDIHDFIVDTRKDIEDNIMTEVVEMPDFLVMNDSEADPMPAMVEDARFNQAFMILVNFKLIKVG